MKEAHRDMKENQDKMLEKLDDLLALKNKGLGAFWLASIFIGAIFASFLAVVSNFFTSR